MKGETHGKVDLANLRRACENMVKLIYEMRNPATAASGQTIGFHAIANEIRFELDGEESCVASVRERAQRSV